jgi:hypothetical protein
MQQGNPERCGGSKTGHCAPAEITPNAQSATLRMRWRFAFLRWSLASQQIAAGGCLHLTYCRLSRPVFPLRAASWAVALAGRLLCFVGRPDISQQPVHHWRLTNSNWRANWSITYFQ